ncbi:MarR family transcriptional regulator [Brevibacterium aurantiacum]|uniref:MarR family transcriptional regulator n=4 Tax=Micrococcales TaxID=85006 RepID=A0A2A3X3V2_BREAU|nr:MarR family transcriptional regulator [Brevibacterium aurantiacum]PMQ19778.1 MarR family transcriptional regulator [Glutamicibacter arilaitensis]RCS62063.1 MarR family transcriptional regulator [Microbacterium sp. JB110]HCJ55163.1 MarR family transcriptional regulator [Glutamicibacter sp.]AZL11504.1 MarR family transcriptional regulator [Brevibacterium aurantiacum]
MPAKLGMSFSAQRGLVSCLIVWHLMNKGVVVKHDFLLAHVDHDESAQVVMAVLSAARRIDDACAHLLARHGLSEGRFAVLLAVSERDDASPGWIAERLGVTRATVTGLLEGLVKSDFVVRMAAPGDRRSHNIKLTEAGVAVVKELVPVYKEWLRQIADKVATPQDIISSLEQLRHNLRSGAPTKGGHESS